MMAAWLAQLDEWHEEDEFERIVDAVVAIPQPERGAQLTGHLARALNNLGRYGEALEQLHTIAEGDRDAIWHYRGGYAYYYLRRYAEAVQALERADELSPGDEHLQRLLAWSRDRAAKQQRSQERARQRAAKAAASGSATGISVAPPFAGMDLSGFWQDSDYSRQEYVCEAPTDELIASIEAELGYKLPASYIALMKTQNGGIPVNDCFPMEEPTGWSPDHIAITGIMGIGRDKRYSLCGELGGRFMIEEWGYPDIGVVICDCPSAGHDVVMLDYTHCGPDGEPEVIHVDQEDDYEITFVAENFEAFIRGLVHSDVYDTSEQDKLDALERVRNGAFSPLLAELCARTGEPDKLEQQIRAICLRVVEEKGSFSFHADERSYLMYDLQFWLYTGCYPETTREQYLARYSEMIAFGGEFGQRGYAPGFVSQWLDERLQQGRIIETVGILSMERDAAERLLEQVAAAAS